MTAGERNCYLAIGECLDAYDIDDFLVALSAQLTERGPRRSLPPEREHYKRVADKVTASIASLRKARREPYHQA